LGHERRHELNFLQYQYADASFVEGTKSWATQVLPNPDLWSLAHRDTAACKNRQLIKGEGMALSDSPAPPPFPITSQHTLPPSVMGTEESCLSAVCRARMIRQLLDSLAPDAGSVMVVPRQSGKA